MQNLGNIEKQAVNYKQLKTNKKIDFNDSIRYNERMSTEQIAISAAPSLSSNTYAYQGGTMAWGGKTYRLTLELPLENRVTSYSQADLASCGEIFAKTFLQDLKNKLETTPQLPIHPGQNFKVVFDAEGYTAFIPREGTPSDQQIDFFDERAKELSEILELKNPELIVQKLTVRLKPAFISKGLANKTATQCFVNTAFQLWITNPLLRQELLDHPEYLKQKQKEKNPLYLAFQKYMEGTLEDLTDLIKELKINIQNHDDTDVVLRRFNEELDFAVIRDTSPLYARTQKHFLVELDGPENCAWIKDPRFEQPAIGHVCVRLDAIEENQTLDEMLKAQAINDSPHPIHSMPNKVTKQKETFENPPKILTLYARRTLAIEQENGTFSYRADRTLIPFDSLEVEIPEEIAGKATKYELMGYAHHSGGVFGGHWTAYVREGTQFFHLKDRQKISITQDQFLQFAKEGVSFMLNRS